MRVRHISSGAMRAMENMASSSFLSSSCAHKQMIAGAAGQLPCCNRKGWQTQEVHCSCKDSIAAGVSDDKASAASYCMMRCVAHLIVHCATLNHGVGAHERLVSNDGHTWSATAGTQDRHYARSAPALVPAITSLSAACRTQAASAPTIASFNAQAVGWCTVAC
jgi:hypothetical protein